MGVKKLSFLFFTQGYEKKIAEWEASGTGSMSHTVHDLPFNL